MTTSEMEEAIRNLQDQANRLEQFLPSLSTREELYGGLHSLRDELRSEIQDAKRHALMLSEATHDRIKVLAEGLEDVRARMVMKDDVVPKDDVVTKDDLKQAIEVLQ